MDGHAMADLSARERQIMDALYRRGEATVADIRTELPDPPSASAVRTMLLRLKSKGHVASREHGGRNIYVSTTSRVEARRSALDRLVDIFFEGSPLRTVAALLDRADLGLSAEELDEVAGRIEEARGRGR